MKTSSFMVAIAITFASLFEVTDSRSS